MKEFSQHELICGSRTDNCTHCNQRIMLKDMDKHVNSCPRIRESVETAPPRRKKVGRSAEANWAKKEETIQHTEVCVILDAIFFNMYIHTYIRIH